MPKKNKNELPPTQREELLCVLKIRFEKNMNRHKGIEWTKVKAKLELNSEKLWSLNEMERTGGEPDVVGFDKKTGEYIFFDCSAESPSERRSLCYDREALDARKEHKPKDSTIDMAKAMGIELLTEEQYRELQKLGNFVPPIPPHREEKSRGCPGRHPHLQRVGVAPSSFVMVGNSVRSDVLPVLAIGLDHPWMRVDYPTFLAFSCLQILLTVLPVLYLRRCGLLRPAQAPLLSWEQGLFELSRGPWILQGVLQAIQETLWPLPDRKSTRLNSSHRT